jgi:hypothetical protein
VSLCGGDGDMLELSPPRVGTDDSRPRVGRCRDGVCVNLLRSLAGVNGVTCLFLLGVSPYRANSGVSRLLSMRRVLGRVERAEPLLAEAACSRVEERLLGVPRAIGISESPLLLPLWRGITCEPCRGWAQTSEDSARRCYCIRWCSSNSYRC